MVFDSLSSLLPVRSALGRGGGRGGRGRERRRRGEEGHRCVALLSLASSSQPIGLSTRWLVGVGYVSERLQNWYKSRERGTFVPHNTPPKSPKITLMVKRKIYVHNCHTFLTVARTHTKKTMESGSFRHSVNVSPLTWCTAKNAHQHPVASHPCAHKVACRASEPVDSQLLRCSKEMQRNAINTQQRTAN